MALEKHGIGWTMWDYAGGFAVVNKTNGQAQKDPELLKALGLSNYRFQTNCARSMKTMNRKLIICAFVCFFCAASLCFANSRPGKRVSFNQDWRFHLGDVANGQDADFNDSQWRQLDLPHDWSIEGEFSEKLLPAPVAARCRAASAGIARRLLFPLTAKGKQIFIEFDGVYRNSEVWINGHYLGKRPYGYSSFEYELTPHLIYGGEAKRDRRQGR